MTMRKFTLLALASVSVAALMSAAYATPDLHTNYGSKVYICATAQATDLADAAAYAALAWTQIGGVGRMGEIGSNQNIVKYSTWDTPVALKAKGDVDAGSPDLEVANADDDAGQAILQTAGAPTESLPYAIKIVRSDKVTEGGTGSIFYYRALVVGPKRPQGKGEDFDLAVYSLGMVQKEIKVAAT